MKKFFIYSTVVLFPFLIGILFELIIGPGDAFFVEKYSLIIEFPFLRVLLIAIATILGIFCGIIAEKARNIKNKTSIKKILKTIKGEPKTIIAACVSPIIFYSVYIQTNSHPDTVIALLLAFQNGFFWENIFNSIKDSKVNS